MRTVLTQAARAAGLLLAGLLASGVQAADVRPAVAPAAAGPDVHKMVILNGPTYSAHYFSVGLSASDQASLRDLQRAENDAEYADDLQALRREYVSDGITLEAKRRAVQQALYGVSTTTTAASSLNGSGYGPGYYGLGLGYAPGYLYGNYGSGGGYNSYFAGSSATTNYSLANGVGDEGALKNAMAQVIASQATADYATSTARAYTAALNRAAESENVRTALGLNPRGVVTAAAEQARHVTLTPKTGDKIDGTLVDEDGDWMTVETANDQVSVRKADLIRIDRHKK